MSCQGLFDKPHGTKMTTEEINKDIICVPDKLDRSLYY